MMLALSENPPVRSPLLGAAGETHSLWSVAHTKARAEKALAWDLLRNQVPYFLPMVQKTKISGGRKRRLMYPLFPSYVFVFGNADHQHTALQNHHICRLIPVRDQQTLARELDYVDQAIKANVPLSSFPFAAIGRRCRINTGPLRDIEGTVIKVHDASCKIVLQVQMLGQGAVVEIETDLVDFLDEQKWVRPMGFSRPEVEPQPLGTDPLCPRT
jgi:transcription antitermination factor NusG